MVDLGGLTWARRHNLKFAVGNALNESGTLDVVRLCEFIESVLTAFNVAGVVSQTDANRGRLWVKGFCSHAF